MMSPKKRILLVEDDPGARRVLASCLRPTYDVLTAANGEEALDAAASSPQPDLVVSDVTMTGMGGLEFARRLRARPDTAHIPVVFLTAHSSAGDLISGMRAGAEHYLAKPVSIDLLLSTVAHLLRTNARP